MSVGIPIKLFHEACGHVVTLELKTGTVFRGRLLEAEDSLNCQMRDVTSTAKDGKVTQIEQIYVRGSHIRFAIVPDMLRNAPMFKKLAGLDASKYMSNAPTAANGQGGRGGGRGGRGGAMARAMRILFFSFAKHRCVVAAAKKVAWASTKTARRGKPPGRR